MVSASPVRCSMKSWGRMATDSSQMEKAQRIWGVRGKWGDGFLGGMGGGLGGGYFCDLVFVREEDSENGAAT